MNNSQTLAITLSKVISAEAKGQYEKAFQCLSPFWDSISQFPNAIGLSGEESAELFLRFGSVVGFLGNSQQIINSQEISKDLLIQSRQRFLSLSYFEKVAECENYLALVYSRKGQFTEATDWLNESFSRNLRENHPTRLYSFVIEAILDIDRGKYEKVINRSQDLTELFSKHAGDLLNGSFHNHLAIAYKNLGNKDEALKHLKLARTFFQKSDHKIYYGAAENNLAQLLHKVGLYEEAHLSAQKAKKIFEQIGDKTREGYSLETRAQIFIAEGKFEKALKFVNAAILLLEGGESYRKLVESYRTKFFILLQLNRLSEALTVIIAAHNIAALYISQELSKEIIEGVADLILERYKRF
ncbi:MAG: tetratricopeptide repeat protein [Actinomycetota bacterium]